MPTLPGAPAGPLDALARRPALAVVALTSLCAVLFFYRLGDRELASSHEARAAMNAQTVLDTGDWLLPRLFDRRPELQKPPLYYWLVAVIAEVSGGRVDAWAARLPAALAGLATVLLVYGFGVGRGRPLAGLLGAAALATAVRFTWLARVARIDMPLTFTVALALVAFYLAACRRREGQPSRRWLLTAYLALGAGVMLKGPVALVLPLCVGAAWWLLTRAERPGAGLGLAWGVPLMLVVAAPWFVFAELRTGGELSRVFLWYHNVQRGLGGGEGLSAHPWWAYAPRLAIDLLPWSLILPAAAWVAWRSNDREGRFGVVWLAAMLLFLSCMRFKRADYLLPAYPGAALVLGCTLERWYLAAQRPALATVFCAPVLLAVAAWVGHLATLDPSREDGAQERALAGEIRRRTSGHVLLFRSEAHLLAFHTGRPLHTLLEWENLDVWAGKAAATYVVMPPECAQQWQRRLTSGRLVEVLRTTDLTDEPHERPLVLLHTEPAQPATSPGGTPGCVARRPHGN